MQVGPLVGKARHVRLDGSAISHLEVLRSSSGTTQGSLLGVLDTCSTNGGRRLLRGWLCQPLFDVQQIRMRQDAVRAMLAHAELMDSVHGGCSGLPDMDRCVRCPVPRCGCCGLCTRRRGRPCGRMRRLGRGGRSLQIRRLRGVTVSIARVGVRTHGRATPDRHVL